MSLTIHLPSKNFSLKDDKVRPVYSINGIYYDIDTLTTDHYHDRDKHVLFTQSYTPQSGLMRRPLLIETKHGGIIVDTLDDGTFSLGNRKYSKTRMNSPMIEVYPMTIPDLTKEQPIPIKLKHPNLDTWHLLKTLAKFKYSMNEYLGLSDTAETGIKFNYRNLIELHNMGALNDLKFIPSNSDTEFYSKMNILIIGKTSWGHVGTIAKLHKSGEQFEPALRIQLH